MSLEDAILIFNIMASFLLAMGISFVVFYHLGKYCLIFRDRWKNKK